MLNTMWRRATRSRDLRLGKTQVDYQPKVVTFDQLTVTGQMLVDACRHYHEATLDYMIGLGLYRQIRLDRDDHRVRLVSLDTLGTVANRAQGHRVENIYEVAAQLRVGQFNVFSTVCLMPVLASDFDVWAKWKEDVRKTRTIAGEAVRGDKTAAQTTPEDAPPPWWRGELVDAHGRMIERDHKRGLGRRRHG
jgi:hypothetical protein